jgi:Flp pilus assembly protein TadD
MKRFFNKALLLLSLCVLGSCFQAIDSPCPAADSAKTKKNHSQSLTRQDKSALDWVTGGGKSVPPGNAASNPSGAPPTHTTSTSAANDLSNKNLPGKTVGSPPQTKAAPVGEAAGIGDLESIIKTIKQQQATIDLKAVGDSIIILRRKITNNPEDPILRQRVGALLYLAGDYEGAAGELKHAISLKPNNYVAHALLGRVLADAGEREASSMEFHTAIALAPTVAATHCLYAESLVSRGDVSEGINEFRRSIGIKPNAMALTGLAEALMIAQDVDGALKAARQAVSEESNSPDAYVALTKAMLLSGDTEGAARTAREALLLNPNSAASHIAVGRTLYATGKPEAAVEEFRQAVSIDPLNADARNDLGYALYAKGDIGHALAEFRLALRLNPHLNEARNNLEIAIHALAGTKHN